jgi:hypothetical protein
MMIGVSTAIWIGSLLSSSGYIGLAVVFSVPNS